MVNGYLILMLDALMQIAFSEFSLIIQGFNIFCFILIIRLYIKIKKDYTIDPLLIYSFIWLLLITLTSFEFPLMPAMNSTQWELVGFGNLAFGLSGFLFYSYVRYKIGNAYKGILFNKIDKVYIGNNIECLMIFLLCISIVALIVNFYLSGSFALFNSDPQQRKTSAFFSGFYLLVTLGGFPAIIYPAIRKNSKKLYLLLITCYIFLCVLLGHRWNCISVIVCMLLSFGILGIKTKELKFVIYYIIFILIAFVFISIFRGGVDDKQLFFVDSGIYNGDAKTLALTEIFRYTGYSQRLMELVHEKVELYSDCNIMNTFHPLLYLFGVENYHSEIDIYGYNALNAFSYMEMDFGFFWPVAVFLWGICANYAFVKFRIHKNIFFLLLSVIFNFSIFISFYSWVQWYVFYAILFPIMAYIIDRFRRNAVKDNSLYFINNLP